MKCYNSDCEYFVSAFKDGCTLFNVEEMEEYCKKFKPSKFEIDDKVWHPGFGNGTVIRFSNIEDSEGDEGIDPDDYPIVVDFPDYVPDNYDPDDFYTDFYFTAEGKYYKSDVNVTLYKGHDYAVCVR